MKHFSYILLLLTFSNVNAQEWRDSLSVARSLYTKQEYAKALKYYQSAQKKAPNNIDLSDEIGQSAYKANEFEKAEKIYQQSASTKKNTSEKAKTYHNLGNSRMQKKDFQGAVNSYKEALRNNPNEEETRYNLSEAIRKLKEEKKQQQNQQKNTDNQQNKNKKDPQNSKDKQDQQQNKQQNNTKTNNPTPKEQQKSPSRLPNKSVERMLDQLSKSEAETKRKMGGSRQKENSIKSGKDW